MSKTDEPVYQKGGYEVHEIKDHKSPKFQIQWRASNPRWQYRVQKHRSFRFKTDNEKSREKALDKAVNWVLDANGIK